ncbi:LOW QUALITY PROTEIN: L-type lectin-domain containing receptor kinase VIII.1-like [Dioscorea cayenensis subsp. rotundata]|uniref:non-specific serine/threonine protein kinase n=1 Tax=Dioscorea cayennensis subsp. rotundata TaxID=55577 RepID=A0AB40BP44_DIOCR|nr:LOW QUALITY PROTEIN: L-type lectin-domain containing receptor kinase VIII.1-like [Dioscorea cayenensis subsp. rotundata]
MPSSLLLLLLFIHFLLFSEATKFDLTTLSLTSLKLLGDAHLHNGTIRLSRDLPVPNSGAGRALFSDPIPLRHPVTHLPLPFSTFFSFSITNLNPSSIGGGLAFLLSPDDHSLGDSGAFLGLLNSSSSSPSPVLAVEFDTLMDVEFHDINGNHVGIDLGSMVSSLVTDLDSAGIDLKSGDLVNSWIEFDDDGVLQVFVSYSTVRPSVPALSFPIDLSQFVQDSMFVGFSASTQGSTEIHTIEWWTFSSSSSSSSSSSQPPPSPSPPVFSSTPNVASPSPPSLAPSMSVSVAESPKNGTTTTTTTSSSCQNNRLCRQGPAAVAGVATAGVFVVASCAGVAFWVFARRSKSFQEMGELAAAAEIVNAPREFSYKELSAATRSFDSSRIIGHGAFGTVYKGIVPETGALIAVKRCIHNDANSVQGRAEFLSELSIIASLRHRNLVRLQGWCHEKGEILLVYDYMIHGSLDKALFETKSPALGWRHRKEILTGVASALAYLHRECERQVIHRDVKSSNVMLDEGFRARLGDFGLARQVEHDKSPDATVTAGTMGYLAPEYLLTGRATEKTDVFSFGALVLEVVSGRRPIDGNEGRNLVEWVWRLHGEGRIMAAVDERMGCEFDEAEVRRVLLVGLACSSPDAVARPAMRSVVQMLSGETEPPFVPGSKPSMSFSSNHHLLLSLQDSVSDYNGLLCPLSSLSSSTSSLRSTVAGGVSAGDHC